MMSESKEELQHHSALTDYYMLLTSSLLPDKKLLVDLQTEGILTQESVNQILERRENTEIEARRKLVYILLHDPSELNFQRFLKILTLNSQKKLCEKLVEKYKQYYEPWRDIQEPLAGVLLKTETIFVESVREKYKSMYQFIPRKPWLNKDFMEMDKLFVNLKMFFKNCQKIQYKDYRDIFTDITIKSNRYVITGGPGAGKSTLTCKIAFDWAMRRLDKYVCVVLIKAREIKSDINICQYAAEKYMSHEKYSESVCDSVSNLLESGRVLILIDGFDEFQHCKNQSNHIMKLINGNMYSSTPVIITTRPHYIPYLEHNPVSAIATFTICGFSQDNVKQYIKLYFSGDKSKSADQIDHIIENITHGIREAKMWDVVKIPIICLLICFLYEQLKEMPKKTVDVHVQLMAAFKKLYQTKETVNGPDDIDWEGVLLSIGELALDLLLAEEGGRLVFKHDDLSKYIHPEVACKTGLINLTDPVPTQGITGLIDDCNVKWYQFLHKSVQEFCAAYYIHKSGDMARDKVKCLVRDMSTLRSAHEVIQFAIGLHSGNSVVDEVLSRVVHVLNSDSSLASIELSVYEYSYLNLWCDQMRWLHEVGITHRHVSNIKVLYLYTYDTDGEQTTAHYDSYISGLMKAHNDTQETGILYTSLRYINFGQFYTPSIEQMTSLRNVISVSRHLSYLVGSYFSVPDLGEWLVKNDHPHLEVIDLQWCKLSSQSVCGLIGKLPTFAHLKRVCLCHIKIDPDKVSVLDIPQCSESLTSLMHINLRGCAIRPVLPLVSYVIALSTNLRELDLSDNTIDEESTYVKPQRDHNHKKSTKTKLKKHTYIFTSVSSNIEVINLSECNMNTSTLRSLCQCIPHWTQLRELNLNHNDLCEVGRDLVQSMPVSIQALYLYKCNLPGNICSAFSKCLASWHCLQRLDLRHSSLSGQCIHIVQSLPQCIVQLQLSNCKLNSEDMCAVARQLPKLTHLTVVNSSRNPQSEVIVWEVFTECLPHCRSGLEVWLEDCGIDMDTEQRLKKSNTSVLIVC